MPATQAANAELKSHPSAASRALKKVLGEGVITAAELGELCGVTGNHVNRVAREEAYLSHPCLEKIGRFITDNNDTRFSRTFFGSGWRHQRRLTGEANGTIDDDLADIMQALGHLRDHQETLDRGAARRTIRAIRKEVRDFEAEIEEWE